MCKCKCRYMRCVHPSIENILSPIRPVRVWMSLERWIQIQTGWDVLPGFGPSPFTRNLLCSEG